MSAIQKPRSCPSTRRRTGYAMNRTVHVAVDDPAAAVEMYYNGKPVSMVLSTLEIGGNYQYRLTDSAGNERYYAIKMADRVPYAGTGDDYDNLFGVSRSGCVADLPAQAPKVFIIIIKK